MKALLINPPELRTIQANLPGAVENLRGATPPISLMCVAAAARESGRHKIALLDAHALGLDYEALEKAVGREKPDVVGITATTFTLLDAVETARRARKAWPKAALVCGGLQPFLYPKETVDLGAFDYGLQGEADRTFPRMLDLMEEGRSLDDLPGILFRKNGRTVLNSPAPMIEDLDSLPMPAHDLLPLRRYKSLVTGLAPVSITVTGRGCPFHCAYCSRSVTGKRSRNRSAENVAEEMAFCLSVGIRYLLIYDEVMTIRKRWVMDLCGILLRRKSRLRFMARAKVGTVDPEMLAALAAAGCDLMTMGVESGSPKVLERLNRPTDIEALVRAFSDIRKAGLRSIAYFMIGNPDEAPEDFRASVEVARRLKSDMVHASVFVPYPATDLYEEGLRTGRFKTDYWREFSAKPSAQFHPRFWGAEGTEQVAMGRLAAFYRQVYLRPSYILRRLVSVRGLSDLARDVKGFFTVLSKKGWSLADGSS